MIKDPIKENYDVKKAKISYTYYCTPLKPLNNNEENWKKIKAKVKDEYSMLWFDDNEKDIEERNELTMIRTSQNFLHGGGLTFPCHRVLIDDFSLSHRFVNIKEDHIMLSYYPGPNILQFSLNIVVENISLSTLVYLRQVFCDNPVFRLTDQSHEDLDVDNSFAAKGKGTWRNVTSGSDYNEKDEVYVSVESLFRSTLKSIGLGWDDKQQSILIELNDLRDLKDVHEIEKEEGHAIYGLLTGDEGYKFVPDSVIHERLKNHWGSRNFMRYYSFGQGNVLVNLDSSDAYSDYLKRQNEFGGTFYGGVNPYFLIDCQIPGVAHGIMFSLEMIMIISTIANRIYLKQEEFSTDKSHDFGSNIRKTREYRRELIATLRMVENLGISEMGELEKMMLSSQNITSLVDSLKYLLELIESELDLLYSTNTNRLVNILTIVGLGLTMLGILLDYIL
ncbi:MAG: hypothetical protein MJ171_01255 [Clostridia bacterium]|nr:hypothetical protein [Clostridia bacterium]